MGKAPPSTGAAWATAPERKKLARATVHAIPCTHNYNSCLAEQTPTGSRNLSGTLPRAPHAQQQQLSTEALTNGASSYKPSRMPSKHVTSLKRSDSQRHVTLRLQLFITLPCLRACWPATRHTLPCLHVCMLALCAMYPLSPHAHAIMLSLGVMPPLSLPSCALLLLFSRSCSVHICQQRACIPHANASHRPHHRRSARHATCDHTSPHTLSQMHMHPGQKHQTIDQAPDTVSSERSSRSRPPCISTPDLVPVFSNLQNHQPADQIQPLQLMTLLRLLIAVSLASLFDPADVLAPGAGLKYGPSPLHHRLTHCRTARHSGFTRPFHACSSSSCAPRQDSMPA